jgi:NAD(P)-dependent dehydrogenase (short-subunit alcohol dehydrogenase family)
MTLAGRDEKGLGGTRKLCEYLNAPVQAVSGDITRPEDCQRIVDKAASFSGSIDVVVLNAGVSMWARFEEIHHLNVFDEIMRVNYLGVVNLLHAALPLLRESRGVITCISSIQGLIGVPYHTGYSASKHALQGFFESLRSELRGSGIHILMVYPTWLTGTRLRARAFGPSGEPLPENNIRKNRSHAIPVEECSAKIIQALIRKRTRLFVPGKFRYLALAGHVFPGVLNYLVSRKVDKQT